MLKEYSEIINIILISALACYVRYSIKKEVKEELRKELNLEDAK